MSKILCLCLFISGTILLHAQSDIRSRIEELLPPSQCKVEVMDVVYPKRFQELTLKMQVAAATNTDWFVNYIKANAKPGQPLPYDKNFGLTKDEYNEFLSLGEKRELKCVETVDLTVTTNGNSFEFHTGGALPDLEAVKFLRQDLAVKTPFGTLTNPAPAHYEGSGPIGSYTGYQWQFEAGGKDLNNYISASFLVGRAKTGKNFIYYKGSNVKDGNAVKDAKIFIYYDGSGS